MIYTGDNKQIKTEFKKILLDNDLTQVEVSNRLNISNNQLNNTFNKINLSFVDVYKMLQVIGYDMVINFVPKSE